jgi:hypothetical protein
MTPPPTAPGLSYGFDATGATNPVDGLYFKHGRGMYSAPADLAQMVDGLAEMPLMFQPGDNWQYSLGIDVVGCLVQVQPWAALSFTAVDTPRCYILY